MPDDSDEAAVPPSGDRPTREHLTVEDVAKVAHLAMLDLADDELGRFTGQLDAVLDLAAELDAFDLDDVPPTSHPFGLRNVFREDLAETDAEADEVRRLALANAPEVEDGRFKVPPALGEAP